MLRIMILLLLSSNAYNLYANETVIETVSVHLPYENAVNPHCVTPPKSFPKATMSELSNPHTGFKQCEVFIDKKIFYKKYNTCTLSGQSFEAYKDKAASMSCDTGHRTYNTKEYVYLHASGVLVTGSCNFKCFNVEHNKSLKNGTRKELRAP